jgi:hypothetical protein
MGLRGITGPQPGDLPSKNIGKEREEEALGLSEDVSGFLRETGEFLKTGGEEVERAISPATQKFLKESQLFLGGEEPLEPPTEVEPGVPGLGVSRIAAGVALTPKQELEILQAQNPERDVWEDPKKPGRFLFDKKGNNRKNPKAVDPKEVSGLLNKVREVAIDIAEGVSGPGVELAGTLGAETVAGIAGGAIGGPIVGAGALVAAAPFAGALGVAEREGIAQALGGKPIEGAELEKQQLMAAGLNVGIVGAGAIARPVLGVAAKGVREFKEAAPMVRVFKAASLRKQTKDVLEKLGKAGDLEETEVLAENAFAVARKGLGKHVDIARKKAEEIIDPKDLWDAGSFMERAGEILEDAKFKQGISTDEIGDFRTFTYDSAKLGRGSPKGEMRDLVEMYNKASKNGGRLNYEDFRVIQNKLSPMFEVTKPKGLSARLQSVYGAAADDEAKVIKGAMPDDAWVEFHADATRAYGENIGAIRKFRKVFQTAEGPEKIIKTIFKPEEVRTVRAVKQILHPDSMEWSRLQATWEEQLLKKVTDQNTGAIRGDLLKGELDKFGEPFVKEVLGETGSTQLQLVAKKANELALGDISLPDARQVATDVIKLKSLSGLLPSHRAAILYRLTGFSSRAAKQLNEASLTALEQTADNKILQDKVMRTMDAFRRQLKLYKEVEKTIGGKKRTILVPRVAGEVATAEALLETERAAEETVGNFIR